MQVKKKGEKKEKGGDPWRKALHSPAQQAPDGNQMEEKSSEGSSLRIYPFSSGKVPPQTTNMRGVMQDSCSANTGLIILSLSKQHGLTDLGHVIKLKKADFYLLFIFFYKNKLY